MFRMVYLQDAPLQRHFKGLVPRRRNPTDRGPESDSGLSAYPLDSHVLRDVTLLPTLQPMESVVLTFEVDRSGTQLADGNHSNEGGQNQGTTTQEPA